MLFMEHVACWFFVHEMCRGLIFVCETCSMTHIKSSFRFKNFSKSSTFHKILCFSNIILLILSLWYWYWYCDCDIVYWYCDIVWYCDSVDIDIVTNIILSVILYLMRLVACYILIFLLVRGLHRFSSRETGCDFCSWNVCILIFLFVKSVNWFSSRELFHVIILIELGACWFC